METGVGALEGQLWCKVLICDIWETFKALKEKTFFFKKGITWGGKHPGPLWPKTSAEKVHPAALTGRAGIKPQYFFLVHFNWNVFVALNIKNWQKKLRAGI